MPEIQMPKLSDTMTEGTLVAWKKKKGDQVSAGEVIAEIETDKATMEWESPEDGTLAEIYVQEGGKVNVGDRIAFIGGETEEAPMPAPPIRSSLDSLFEPYHKKLAPDLRRGRSLGFSPMLFLEVELKGQLNLPRIEQRSRRAIQRIR